MCSTGWTVECNLMASSSSGLETASTWSRTAMRTVYLLTWCIYNIYRMLLICTYVCPCIPGVRGYVSLDVVPHLPAPQVFEYEWACHSVQPWSTKECCYC